MPYGTEPITQHQVESRIISISDSLEQVLDELVRLSDEAAEAEVAHKVKYAQEVLKAAHQEGSGRNGKMTEGDKDATATVNCEDELRKRLISEARAEVTREKGRTMRARLDALRSINANLRSLTS